MKNEGLFITAKETVELRGMPMPEAAPGKIVVKTAHVGICGSDLHFYENPDNRFKVRPWELPILVGHEVAGEVVAVGDGVHNVRVGDRVAVEPGHPCGVCEYCRRGLYNLCPDMSFMSSPPNIGAFRRYFDFPAEMAFRLPDNVSTLEGALLEPLAVGLHAAKLAGVKLGDTVVIFGCGCIGLTLLLSAKARGACRVIAVDIFENRLQKALTLGADATVNSAECDAVQRVRELLDGDGPNVVFEATGNPAVLTACALITRPDTTIACVGSMPMSADFSFPARAAVLKELRLLTVHRYRNMYPIAIRAIAEGKIDIKAIATHIFPFSEGVKAFQQALHNKREIVKAVIEF